MNLWLYDVVQKNQKLEETKYKYFVAMFKYSFFSIHFSANFNFTLNLNKNNSSFYLLHAFSTSTDDDTM